jgi:hypothetical protein
VRVERSDASGENAFGQNVGAVVHITAVLCVRNEGAFLLEWLAHHRACGVTDFLVFSNDCDDGSDAMLDRLQDLGWLTHVRNPGPHDEGPQWAALKKADAHPMVTGADWLLPLDIDEFVNVHVGDRTIPALIAQLPAATAVTLTWRLFGSAGAIAYHDAPVAETFTRAAPSDLHWPWRAHLFKTLVRNDGSYGKLGVHRPRAPAQQRMAEQRWFDGSGRALPSAFHTNRIFTDVGRSSHTMVQLNHYPLGAIESFVLKCDRGRAVHADGGLNAGYWVERNFNTVEDRSIQALDSRAFRSELHGDAILGPLHRAAVDWRHDRFTSLMQDDAWRSLYGQLLLAGPTRVLSREEAESIWKPHLRPTTEKR